MEKERTAVLRVASVKTCIMRDGGVPKTLYKCAFILADGDIGAIYTQTEVAIGDLLEVGLKLKDGGKLEPFIMGFAEKANA